VKFKRPETLPPPLFTGEKEKDFVKQINDEISERVIGQPILYYPIDIERTNFHSVYGEAIEKTFHAPIHAFALVLFKGVQTTSEDAIGADKMSEIQIAFQTRRISEDQNIVVREGDFVLWGRLYYEIENVKDMKELFGRPDERFSVLAECRVAQQDLFDGL
jgi:hypothetical protein